LDGNKVFGLTMADVMRLAYKRAVRKENKYQFFNGGKKA
jgi:hypothetical protein